MREFRQPARSTGHRPSGDRGRLACEWFFRHGLAAQALLVIGIIGYVLPWFRLHMPDVAHNIADFNLPEQVLEAFR